MISKAAAKLTKMAQFGIIGLLIKLTGLILFVNRRCTQMCQFCHQHGEGEKWYLKDEKNASRPGLAN